MSFSKIYLVLAGENLSLHGLVSMIALLAILMMVIYQGEQAQREFWYCFIKEIRLEKQEHLRTLAI